MKPSYLTKHSNLIAHDKNYKGRAASSSLNKRGEDKFLFRPPTQSTINIPTPKGFIPRNEEKNGNELRPKFKRDHETGSKIKRLSHSRAKKITKSRLINKDSHHKSHRLSSRNKQQTGKARLVYKKDSMKTMNSNIMKNEISLGGMNANHSKAENKENEFANTNTNNLKLNRTSSGRNTNNIKSMSGIRKLYTLKANNSNRRLESHSYRDLNIKNTNTASKNEKISQMKGSTYHSSMTAKAKKVSRNKTSTSETPKLRAQNESLFHRIKPKPQVNIGDKENMKPNNYTAN